ncbi:Bug family tripartite tricarboxylate transporter substrate binding protein [Azospirillum oleiclasticum]|nr:tripartite tricarboxylate transporter substrate binding protein [Azospirillum oleiclasticum]
MRRLIAGVVAGIIGMATLPAAADGFPARDLQGIIMWGPGGTTDKLARVLTPIVEEKLGRKVVLVNKAGGSGAISAQYVHARPADGYTILYGSESPQIHGVLGLSNISYKDFVALAIFADTTPTVLVRNDAPWKSLADLVAAMKAEPGKIRMGSTGPAGTAAIVGTMLKMSAGVTYADVPFEGEGPTLTALQGGHIDFTPVTYPAASELIRSGKVRVLTVVHPTPYAPLPDVPPVVADYPELAKYLPWGPFQGVFVRRDTPPDVVGALTAAYRAAAADPRFVGFVKDLGATHILVSGAEADALVTRWQSITSWLLDAAGAAKVSPASLGIPRP